MKIVAITQARVSSSRLPGKVLLPLGDKTVLDSHLARIRKSKKVTDFVVASADEEGSANIHEIARRNKFIFFAGSVNDVLDRFYQSAKDLKPEVVIRLTSDCPLIDPFFIDDLVSRFLEARVDYATNCLEANLPDGMDAEVFTFEALETAWKEATLKSDREHVTPYIRNSGKFKVLSVNYSLGLENVRMTLDTEADYQMLQELVRVCGTDMSMNEYVDYLKSHSEVAEINSNQIRNEGYIKSLKGDSKC